MNITSRFLFLSCSAFLISPVFAQSDLNRKDSDAIEKAKKVDTLVETANNFMVKGQFQKAEPILDKAMELGDAKQKLDAVVIDKLVQVYCAEKKWTKAEKLLETKGRIIWNSEAVDLRVAELLSKNGQNAEAFVILRKFVPAKISANATAASNIPTCGDATEDARRIRTLFFTAGYKSLAFSEKELQEIEKNREQKLARWKAETKS